MRKDCKQNHTVAIAHIQGYHDHAYGTNYAFSGFTANKYFTSDRYIKLDGNFNRPDGKPLKGFGLEIETECSSITNPTVLAEVLHKIVFAHFPADLFKLQHDGSLGGNSSAEIITQVMTKEFIRNNYAGFKAMYKDYFPALRISCSASGNCGMHTNMSNALFGSTAATQETAIKKLLYFVNKNFTFACILLNRNPNRTTYCRRMHSFVDMNACKAANLSSMVSDHGICFNMGHYREGRIELRLVGGQDSFGCFRNTMESVFHLIEACKRCSWADMDDLTKVFAGCNQYVYDRLNTKCRAACVISAEQLATIQPTVKVEELL